MHQNTSVYINIPVENGKNIVFNAKSPAFPVSQWDNNYSDWINQWKNQN